MPALTVQVVALTTVWILWRLVQRILGKPALRNIPGPPASSYLTGVLTDLYDVNSWQFQKDISEKYGGVSRIEGLLCDQSLYISDPQALRYMLLKDQDNYEETEMFSKLSNLVVGPGLLASLGEKHRKQRKILNPVFSINHLREMIPTFHRIAHQLGDALARRVKNGPREIDVASWLTRTALELVAQSGLGYSFDDLTDDGDQHPYSIAARELIPTLQKTIIAQVYLMGPTSRIGTPKFRRFVLDLLPWKAAHDARDIVDIMWNTCVNIYESKKKALLQGDALLKHQILEGKDIISILMRANISAAKEDQLTEDEVIGQMSTLTFAAMDTTSSALARTLWVLAEHPNVQVKLRSELQAAMVGDNDIGYDSLVSLPYLDAVCRETLRLYPPVSLQSRSTRQDVTMPLSTPIVGRDGTLMQEIHVPKDTTILISILNCNRDPRIWGPDSYEFKPERWLNALPDSVTAAKVPGIYSNLMTFLGGGRACIGFKFSQLEMKVVLSLLILRFSFSIPDDKEIVWKANGVASSSIKGSNAVHPQLPLIVEFAK